MDFDNIFFETVDNFSLNSYGCIFNTELVSDANGERNALVVRYDKTRPIRFAFQGSSTLCTTTEFGTPMETNLLEQFISLPIDKAKPTLQFFEKYGFLFPITDDFLEVDLHALTEIMYRLKATTLLMTALSKKELDYNQILHLTLYLLLSRRVKFKTGERTAYSSYQHAVLSTLDTPTVISHAENIIENENGEFINVKDLIYSPTYLFASDEYEDISSGETFLYNYPGISDALYKKITYMYVSQNTLSKQHRLIIEFLFHLMHDIGVIKEVSIEGIEYYGTPNYDDFSLNMKNALYTVAKIILAGEINYNISKMRPVYSAASLAPSWKAPNLLTALYFSAFYMKPGSEIYRKCANPTCSKYFQTKTTNSRKIYCCKKCRDAANQRAHRHNK